MVIYSEALLGIKRLVLKDSVNTFFRKGRFAMLFPEPRLNENLPWKEVASNSSLYHVDHLAREKPKNI